MNSFQFNFKTSDPSSNSGDRRLTFTYTLSSGASTSQSKNVTANQCVLGYGTRYSITYTVYTHPTPTQAVGSELSSTPVTETLDQTPLPSGTQQGDGALDLNGQFTDRLASRSSQPLTCSATVKQYFQVAGIQVRTNTLTFGGNVVSVTNNGPTQ